MNRLLKRKMTMKSVFRNFNYFRNYRKTFYFSISLQIKIKLLPTTSKIIRISKNGFYSDSTFLMPVLLTYLMLKYKKNCNDSNNYRFVINTIKKKF